MVLDSVLADTLSADPTVSGWLMVWYWMMYNTSSPLMSISLGGFHVMYSSFALMFTAVKFSGGAVGTALQENVTVSLSIAKATYLCAIL